MPTTIQVSDAIKEILEKMKMIDKESYNDVIKRMIEDNLEVSEKTRKELEEARARVSKGKYVTMKEVEQKLGL